MWNVEKEKENVENFLISQKKSKYAEIKFIVNVYTCKKEIEQYVQKQ